MLWQVAEPRHVGATIPLAPFLARMMAAAILFTWVQLLMGLIALETYWFNTREQHVLPVGLMVAMSVGITALSVLAMIVYVALRGWLRPVQVTCGGD